MRRKNLPALTSIRFFAALWVVFYHILSRFATDWPFWIRNTIQSGFVGVPLFFVLSGFILTYTYILSNDEVDARRFWTARFARIYPMHFVAFVFAVPFCLWNVLHKAETRNAAMGILTTPLLLQSWNPRWLAVNLPSWSLSVEAFFYLVFPVVGVWFARKSRTNPVRWFAGAWLVSLIVPAVYMLVRPDGNVAVTYLSSAFWLEVVKFNPLVRLPEFLMGIALAQQFARMSTFRGASWYAAGAAAAVLTITSFAPVVPFVYLNNSLLAPLMGMLILCLAFENGASKLLANKYLVLLGDASYSLYIIHVVVISWTNAFFRHVALRSWDGTLKGGVLQICACIALSVVTYKLFEVPARRFISGRLNAGAKWKTSAAGA